MPDTEEVETTDTDQENTDAEETADAVDKAEDDPLTKLKTALAAERKLRRDEERKRKAAEEALSLKDKPADEAALDRARREGGEAVLSKAHERIVRAELRAAAAGKVSNLNALSRLVNVDEIDVDDDGNPSDSDIEDAITQFLADYPEFAADKAKFSGTADQGRKGETPKPKPPSVNDLIRAAAKSD